MEKPEISDEKSKNGSRHVFWGDAIFFPFSVCSADFKILCSGSHSNHVKFFSFKFMHKISMRIDCAIGK